MPEVRDWDDEDDAYEEWDGGEREDGDGSSGGPDAEEWHAEVWDSHDPDDGPDGDGSDSGSADDDWEPVGVVVDPVGPAAGTAAPLVGERCPECSAVVPAGMPGCPSCLAPAGASRRSEPPAGTVLRLVFRTGGRHLDVPRGAELRLGRSSSWAPESSGVLAGEESVSGRHATVVHGADGAAWVTEVAQGATNGTRVNGHVLVPDRAVRLRDGDRVELGPRAAFVVRGIVADPAEPPDRPPANG
ncbi:FHA domain-containing protein [Streptomyces sp. NPDC015171]|uniref:FHA domain-containing protein n=1 Tax=Streptomyces sp. NPDC015171 TaxID=3364945 RepID=UPI0036FC48CE